MAEIYNKEFFDETRGRGAIYEYLSLVLQLPVTKQFLGLSAKFAEVFAELGKMAENQDIIKGAEILKEYAQKEEKCTDEKALLDALNIQWTSIFLTGAANVPCSSSVSITGSEMDEPWERVMEFYHIRGFKKPAGYTESDDHISMELLFMHEMCRLITTMQAKKLYANIHDVLKEQETFLNNFMQDWITDVCNKMAAFCSSMKYEYPLYLAIAYLTKGFIAYDKEYLAEQLHEAAGTTH